MIASYTRLGAAASAFAAFSMAATPSLAADFAPPPVAAAPAQFSSVIYDSEAENADWRRCRGYYCGYRGHRHRGIDAGDVLAGVLVIGGIAAIASAANNNNRREEERRERVRDYEQQRELEQLRQREREQDRELEYLRSRGVDADRYQPSGRAGGFGIEGAIEQCSSVVGRDSPVGDILGVNRTASGWSVRGTLQSQRSFTCTIGSDGEIESLDYSGSFNAVPPASRGEYRASGQLSDARYASARAALSAPSPSAAGEPQPLVPLTAERMPAYPGGPLPGEEIDGDLNP